MATQKQLQTRSVNTIKARLAAKALKKKLSSSFATNTAVDTVAVIGDGLISNAGVYSKATFSADIGSAVDVVNVGRKSSAVYAPASQQAGVATSRSSGGSNSTTTTTTVLPAHYLVDHLGLLADNQAPQFLKLDGSRDLTGNLAVSAGVTVDGVDISVHAADPNAHHNKQHSIISSADHTVTGAQYAVIGLTAVNTLGVLATTSRGDQNANTILRTGASKELYLSALDSPLITTQTGSDLILQPSTKNVVVYGAVISLDNNIVGTSGGAILQGVVDADNSYTRAFVGHNAQWNSTDNLWYIDAIGANDASGMMLRNNAAAIDFIFHVSTGNTSRTMNHASFTAGAKITFASAGRIGVLNTSPSYEFDTTGTLRAQTSVITPLITTTSGDLTIDPVGVVLFPQSQTIKSVNFNSTFPIAGFQFNEKLVGGVGIGVTALTIGEIQADSLAVKVFVADETRVDRGNQIWAKSYGIVAADFTIPSAINGTVAVTFEDSPAMPGALFTNGDWLMFQQIDRTSGLIIAYSWGTVSGYTPNSTASEQTWTFTLKYGATSAVMKKGRIGIDWGQSGQAVIALSTVDAAGSPYIKLMRWVTTTTGPYDTTARKVAVAIGDLGSGVGSTFYSPTGDGIWIQPGTDTSRFLVADDLSFRLQGINLRMYNGSTQTVDLSAADGSLKLGTNIATATALYFNSTAGTLLIGDATVNNPNLYYDGSSVHLRQGTATRIRLDSNGNSYFAGIMLIDTAGEIRQGSGAIGTNYTGLRIWNDTGIGRIAGYNNNTLQWYGATDGKLYAGAGAMVLDNKGLHVANDSTSNGITFYRVSTFTDQYKAGRLWALSDLSPARVYLSAGRSTSDGDATNAAGILYLTAFNGSGAEGAVVSINGSTGVVAISASLSTAALTVSGNITVSGNVDGVDVSAFKSAYDSHNHDSRYLQLSGGILTGTVTADVIRPATNNTKTIGTASFYFAGGYFDKIYVNEIVGTPSYVHTHDGSHITTGTIDEARLQHTWTGALTLDADSAGTSNYLRFLTQVSTGKSWDLIGRAHDYTTAAQQNDLLLTFYDGSTTYIVLQADSGTRIVDFLNTPTVGGTAVVLTTRTVSAGGGLTGGGALSSNITISHSDTSSVADVSNASGNVLQSVTFDTYGHVLTISSINLDGRYYTETESDARFLQLIGGTVTGPLSVTTTTNTVGAFSVKQTDTTNVLSVDTLNARVGAGTGTPAVKLHIYSVADEALRIESSSSTGNPYLTWYQAGTRRAFMQLNDTNDNLIISSEYGDVTIRAASTAGTDSDTTYVVVKAGGNVGFGGQTSPSYTVDVTGTGRFTTSVTTPLIATASGTLSLSPANGNVLITNSSTVQYSNSAFVLYNVEVDDAYTHWYFFAEKSSAGAATGLTSFQIRRRNSTGTEALTPFAITGAGHVVLQAAYSAGSQTYGNVGIKNSSPTYTLDVTGSIRATTSLLTPLLTTVSGDLTIDPSGMVLFPQNQIIRSVNYNGNTPIAGFQINEKGTTGVSVLTIGEIQADSLAVKVFVADETRVDRGNQLWAKSYGIVAADFTIPSAINGTVSVTFEDSPAISGALFTSGDWLMFQQIDRTSGLIIAYSWGTVSGYTPNSSTKEQTWTFTLKYGATSVAIKKGRIAIDWGVSGQSVIALSTVDGSGSPYIKLMRWSGATGPYDTSIRKTLVAIGNLNSGVGNSYYTPSGDGIWIQPGLSTTRFLVADDTEFRLQGIDLRMYNSSNQTVDLASADGSLKLGANIATATALYFNGTTGTLLLGSAASNNPNLYYDGSSFHLRQGTATRIRLDSNGNSYFAGIMLIDTAGEIRQGSGAIGTNYTGLRIWNDSGFGRIAGYNSNTLQWYANTDGKLYAGAGALVLDNKGLHVANDSTSNGITFYRVSTFTDQYKAGRLWALSDLSPARVYLSAGRSTSDGDATNAAGILYLTAFNGSGAEGAVVSINGSTGVVAISASLSTAAISVSGDITVTGNVDGVDVSAFKSAYDTHNHDSRYLQLSGGILTGTVTADVIRPAANNTKTVGTASFYFAGGYFDKIYVNEIVGTPSYVHTHDGSHITTGTLDENRLPHTWVGALTLDADSAGTSNYLRFLTQVSTGKSWDLIGRAHDYTTAAQQNDLLLTFYDGSTTYIVLQADNATRVVDFLNTPTVGGTAVVLTTRTVSAGSGLTGGGALSSNITISHSDTSSVADVSNANGNVLQSVTFDTYGHVLTISSINLDGRYYTETESDARFLQLIGGTLTGNLIVNSGITIDGVDISAHAADVNAHHAQSHSITSSSDHTVTGSQWQLVGLSATNTLGIIDSSSNPGASEKILRSTSAGGLQLQSLVVGSGSGVTASASYNGIVVHAASNPGIQLLTANTSAGVITFGDPEDNDVGRLVYRHNSNQLDIEVGAALRVIVNASGLQVGSTSGSNYITLAGGTTGVTYGIDWSFQTPGTNKYAQVMVDWDNRSTRGLQINSFYPVSINNISNTGTFSSNLLTVLTTGYVGFGGQTSPSYQVDVTGSGRFTTSVITPLIVTASGIDLTVQPATKKTFVIGAVRSLDSGAVGGAILQGVTDVDNSYTRAFVGHNAQWDSTDNLWYIDAIGANDASGLLFRNSAAAIDFIFHTNTGNTARSMSHATFTAGAKITFTSAGRIGVLNTSPSYEFDTTGTLRAQTSIITPLITTTSGDLTLSPTNHITIDVDSNSTSKALNWLTDVTNNKYWHLAARAYDYATTASQQNDLILYWFNGSAYNVAVHFDSSTQNTGFGVEPSASYRIDVSGSARITTSVVTPQITTASGNLSIAPSSNITAVTGAMTVTDTIAVGSDADKNNTLGRAIIGYALSSDSATFSHFDHNTSTNYGLAQTNAGRTILNAPTAQTVDFAIANTVQWSVNVERILPRGSSLVDIGDYNRMVRNLYATQLAVQTLVAENVISTIGGDILVAPTTKLIAAIAATDGGFGTSSLYTGITSLWKLDESSGTRYDAKSTNNLTDSGSTASGVGKQGAAASFAGSTSLSITDNASLSIGSSTMYISGWVYVGNDTGTDRYIAAKGAGTSGSRAWALFLTGSIGSQKLRFQVWSNAMASNATATTTVTLSANTWYFVEAWRSSTQIGVNVNRGTDVTTSWTNALNDDTGAFALGSFAGSNYFTGIIDEFGLWKDYVPNSTERNYLYNSGSGRSFFDIYKYSTTDINVDTEHNSLRVGEYILLKTAPQGIAQYEQMVITGGPSTISGGYRYTATRCQNGGTPKAWQIGDAVASQQKNAGEGYLWLTSKATIHSHVGPSIIGYVRTGTGVNDVVPAFVKGNMRSLVDYVTDEYGDAAGNNLTLTPTTGFRGYTIDRTNGLRLFNTDIKLYNSGTQTVNINNAGNDIWIGVSSSDKRFVWDGTTIALINSNIKMYNGANQTVNINYLGNDVWIGTSPSIKRLTWDGAVLSLRDSTGAQVIVLDGSGSSYFAGAMTIGSSGGIYQGSSGTFSSPATGLKIWNDTGVGRIGGYNSGTLQWYAATDGKLYAGAGAVRLDANGITLTAGTGEVNKLTVYASSNKYFEMNAFYTGSVYRSVLSALSIGGNASEIILQSTYSGDTDPVYIRVSRTSGVGIFNSGLSIGNTSSHHLSLAGGGNIYTNSGNIDMSGGDLLNVDVLSSYWSYFTFNGDIDLNNNDIYDIATIGVGTSSPADVVDIRSAAGYSICMTPNYSNESYIYTFNRTSGAHSSMVLRGSQIRFLVGTSPAEMMKLTSSALTVGVPITVNTSMIAGTYAAFGDITADYSPTTGNWSSGGTTLLLQALNYSAIGFHDSGSRVDFIRGGAGVITLGYDGGFGAARVDFGGTIGTTWSNLSMGSGWTSWDGGSSFHIGQYKKVGDMVFLRGLVRRSSGTGTVIATLPSGYRPVKAEVYDVLCYNGTSYDNYCRIDINTDGTINLTTGNPNTSGFVTLAGMVFSTTS